MPKTVTLSDDELLALQAIRQVVGDVPHPARPAAIALIDRIANVPDDPIWSSIVFVWRDERAEKFEPDEIETPSGIT